MRIEVTKDHIRRGNPGSTVSCAVALAVREQTGDLTVHVGNHGIYAGTWSHTLSVDTKLRMRQFVTTHKVDPFSFDLVQVFDAPARDVGGPE